MTSIPKKRPTISNNNDFRAYKKARLEAEGYKPPSTKWVDDLGTHVPLLTLDFAKQVVGKWDRIDNPSDPCACAMDKLLEYHEHTPYINVLVNFEMDGNGIRTMGIITHRSAFLYALRKGYRLRIGSSLFGAERIFLNDEDIQFLELVYSAEGNDFFAMCDGGYKKTTPYDDFTAWADVQPGYREFCASPKSRLTVDETLVDMGVEKALKAAVDAEEESMNVSEDDVDDDD